MITACNCSFTKPLQNGGCSVATYITCYLNKFANIYDQCNCQRPCETTEYEYQVTTLDYPVLNSNQYGERGHLISMYVYFKKMEYTLIEQAPAKSPMDLLADIGGQLGLCLGASILTMCEIVECVGKIISNRFKAKFLNQKVKVIRVNTSY